MKNFLVLAISLLIAQSVLFSQENLNEQIWTRKKSFHDIQYGLTLLLTEIGPLPGMDLATTHGFRIGNRFSLGAGISTIYFVTLTPYAYAQIDLKDRFEKSRSVPYFYLKAGYMFYLKENDSDNNSIHLEPGFGYSFLSKKRTPSWAVLIAAIYFEGSVFPKIGVAFEF